MVIPSTPAAPALALTRRHAAASTSARCTSPYRLQNRYSGLDFAFRYRVICSCRTLSGAGSPCGPSPRPSLLFFPAEQVASLGSSAGCPNQRSGTGSSLLRTPPTSVVARTASPFDGVAPPVESSLLAMTDLPAYPSVTSRHVAHADPAGPLSKPTTVDPGFNSAAFAILLEARLPGVFFEAHLCGSCVHCDLPVRLHACSPPRLAATQLARSAVLNRLIAPAGLSPALTPASRAFESRWLRVERQTELRVLLSTLNSPSSFSGNWLLTCRCGGGSLP